MYFDDDLLSFAAPGHSDEDMGAGAEPVDFEDINDVGGSGAGSNPESSLRTLSASSLTSSARRKRGSRGGARVQAATSASVQQQKRWRSGAIPQPPSFDGDIEADPYCLRHYRRRLLRWTEITKEYLPPGEQALRALERR